MARAPRILDSPTPGGPPATQQPSPPRPRPRWTAVCGTVLVGSVALFLLGQNHLVPPVSSAPDAARLAEWGNPLALYGPLVQRGEYWRMLSCIFEHGSVLHLLFNMSVVYTLG